MSFTNTYVKSGFWKKSFHPVTGDLSLDKIAIEASTQYSDLVTAYRLMGSSIKFDSPFGSVAQATSSASMTSGDIRIQGPFLVKEADSITGMLSFQVTQGNYTADAYNGVGIYSYDGLGTLTLVASSINDGNIWKATTNTITTKALSSVYSASAGIYFVAFLYHSSAQVAAPALGSFSSQASAMVLDFPNSGKLAGVLSSQSSLPATILMSGLTTAAPFYTSLY